MSDARSAPDRAVSLVQSPPTSVVGTLRRLGPGLIIAASIVGSGELIGTTKTGAEAGFYLLWLIVLGCVIKVFVQVEFGRYAITNGRTSIEGLNEAPGPRLRVSWLLWYWVLMFSLGLGQLGGIVGGVGQALSLVVPITGDVKQRLELQDARSQFDREFTAQLEQAGLADVEHHRVVSAAPESVPEAQRSVWNEVRAARGEYPEIPSSLSYTFDDVYWSGIITAITAVLLVIGRYGLVQNVSAILVAGFTAVTVFNVLALQSQPEWAIDAQDLALGFSFQLPPARAGVSPLVTALSTFGIIGVGASELIAYPYWCLEKGYARFAGPREATDAWAARARGWLMVMHWDAWCSMLIYTFATVAFYLLGAAILNPAGLNPDGNGMLYTLVQMYVPVFGAWAGPLFLLGAFAVLYSTFFVATAGNARMASDALVVFRVIDAADANRQRWVRRLCGLFPFVSLAIYLYVKNPVTLVLVSGMAQSIMLPMLGGTALYFRYRRCDPRIRPGKLWDLLLGASVIGLLIAGGWGLFGSATKIVDLLKR